MTNKDFAIPEEKGGNGARSGCRKKLLASEKKGGRSKPLSERLSGSQVGNSRVGKGESKTG